MRTRSVSVSLTPKQREVLERLSRTKTAPARLVERCRVVLMSADGWENQVQADVLDVDRQRVRRWRHRWAGVEAALAEAEGAIAAAQDEDEFKAKEEDFAKKVLEFLADAERPGAPAKFSPEQVAAIISLACEPPADSGLPISHWTPTDLAREAKKRGIVKSISSRQVDRFLAKRTCDRTRVSTG